MALYTFPYVFTFVTNSLEVIPSDLEEASAILGASSWRTAFNVPLPLVAPALLAGFLVAFLQSMTLFGTPAILALPAGVDTMTTKIWSLFQFHRNWGLRQPRRSHAAHHGAVAHADRAHGTAGFLHHRRKKYRHRTCV